MTRTRRLTDQDLFTWAVVHGALNNPHSHAGLHDNTSKSLLNKLRGPSYRAMFPAIARHGGDPDRSIVSPAAYFTDLIRFIEDEIDARNEIPEAQRLQSRRPDLWEIPLDHHNTEDTLSYTACANRILSGWLKARLQSGESEGGRSGDIGEAEANLAVTNTYGGLPYDAPLAEIRAYLRHLGCDLADIFRRTGAGLEAWGREALGLSVEAVERLNGKAAAQSWLGKAASGEIGDQMPVSDVLKTLGMTRAELDLMVNQGVTETDPKKRRDILKTLILNQYPDETEVVKILPGRGRILELSGERMTQLANTQSPLGGDLAEVLGSYFVRISDPTPDTQIYGAQGVIRTYETYEDVANETNPVKSYVVVSEHDGAESWFGIYDLVNDDEAEVVVNLDESRLQLMANLRLTAKATGWSYADINWLYVTTMYTPFTDPAFFTFLATMKALCDRSGADIEEVAAFENNLKHLPTSATPGTASQFDRLFGTETFVAALPDSIRNNPNYMIRNPDSDDPVGLRVMFNPSWTPRWNFEGDGAEDQAIATALAGAFEISQDDLRANAEMLAELFGTEGEPIPLTMQNLTTLYRLARLPGMLKLSRQDTVDLIGLLGVEGVLRNGVTLDYQDPDALDDPEVWWLGQKFMEEERYGENLMTLFDAIDFLHRHKLSLTELRYMAGKLSGKDIDASAKTGGAIDPGYDHAALEAVMAKARAAEKKAVLTPDNKVFDRLEDGVAEQVIQELILADLLSPTGALNPRNHGPLPPEMREAFYEIVTDLQIPLSAVLEQIPGFPPDNLNAVYDAGILSTINGTLRPFDADLNFDDLLPVEPETFAPLVRDAAMKQRAQIEGIIALFETPDEAGGEADDGINDAAAEAAGITSTQMAYVQDLLSFSSSHRVISPFEQVPDADLLRCFHRLVYVMRKLKPGEAQLACLYRFPFLIAPGAKATKALLSERLGAQAIMHLVDDKALIERAYGAWGSFVTEVKECLTEKRLKQLAKTANWPHDVLEPVAEALRKTEEETPGVKHLAALEAVFQLAESLKVAPQFIVDLRSLADARLMPEGGAELDTEAWQLRRRLAADLRIAAKSRAPKSDWPKTKAAINDPLDLALRDALNQLVLTSVRTSKDIAEGFGEIDDLTGLYGYLLLDVEAEGVTRISPLKQGLNSLQLYIHRCRLGLEPSVKTEIPAARWSWLEHYRVWEANRRVFLYPETYLHPSMRPGKSPEFRSFESTLLQSQSDPQAILEAIAGYLSQLEDISGLQIIASCGSGADDDSPRRDLFFLARNPKTEGEAFYLRRAVLDQSKQPETIVRWDNWGPLGVKIGARARPTLVHAMGRLFLIWADTVVRKESIETGGQSEFREVLYSTLKYSFQTAGNQWVRPRTLMPETRIMDNKTTATFTEEFKTKDGSRKSVTGTHNTWSDDIAERPIWAQVGATRIEDDSGAESILIAYGDSTFNLWMGTSYFGNPAINWENYAPIFSGRLTAELLFVPDKDISALIDGYTGETAGETCGYATAEDALAMEVGALPRGFVFDNCDAAFLFIGHREYFDRMMPEIAARRGKGEVIAFCQEHAGHKGYVDIHHAVGVWPLGTNAPARLSRNLLAGGVDALYDLDVQRTGEVWFPSFSPSPFLSLADTLPRQLVPDDVEAKSFVRGPGPIDFNGAFGNYFWEVFYHIPLSVAQMLNTAGKYEEAQAWYHRIFDPSARDTGDGNARDGIWQFLPFRDMGDESLKKILTDRAALTAYRDDPMDPHAIARLRPDAYRRNVVMRYIDNLIDWGDALFSQPSWENLGQARMLYVLARDLLGPRPEAPAPGVVQKGKTYSELKAAEAAFDFSALYGEEIANELETTGGGPETPFHAFDARDLRYFHVPENEGFLEYWDRVEDRLGKIRSGKSISGQDLKLPLFQPQIDPNDLIGHIGAGKGLGITSGAMTEMPNHRFSVLIDRAKSVAGRLTGLGASLLSALEQSDAEAFAQARTAHEASLLDLTGDLLQSRIDDAAAAVMSLQWTKLGASQRLSHYTTLLDKPESDIEASAKSDHREGIYAMQTGMGVRIDAVAAHMLPTIGGTSVGGFQPGSSVSEFATIEDQKGQVKLQKSALHMTNALFDRRNQDWELQKIAAQNSIHVIDAQIEAAKARLKAAQQDLKRHLRQVQNSAQVKDFLTAKFTSQDLFTWAAGQLTLLYAQTYELALGVARNAQTAFAFELDSGPPDFLDHLSLDRGRRGLLAGEHLMLALERMEQAYLTRDERRLEIEKTVSLLSYAPEALIALKSEGSCRFSLSERLFDYDFPGHYRRKIKSVSISILAMVGPYQTVQATLTQTDNQIVLKPDLKAVKALLDPEAGDPHSPAIRSNWRPDQRIAVSKGIDDAGQFELKLQDDRYVPFEGTGAVSGWKLDMPKASNRIDFDAISDVVVRIKYTAVQGPDGFARDVAGLEAVSTYLGYRLVSLRDEFSADWNGAQAGKIAFTLDPALFPVNLLPGTLTLGEESAAGGGRLMHVYGLPAEGSEAVEMTFNGTKVDVTEASVAAPKAPGDWTVEVAGGDLSVLRDILLVIPFSGRVR